MYPINGSPPPNNLPQSLTSFIGRAVDVQHVRQELAAARLLTLTGPGGAGKTRLALEVAAQVAAEFSDGTWWCDLAGVADPAHVAQTVSSILHVAEPAGESALDSLTNALRTRHVLLVLDNCEHVVAACAALSQAILRACPGVRLLATSLQPLGLPQERVWPVPPLLLTASGSAAEPDAVCLFVDRATRALPSFRLTAENRAPVLAICGQVDGLPLALELAAARARLLTVEQIAQRLDDAFGLLTRGSLSSLPRHQTLRLAIDWSYQILSDAERALLHRLAVFAGPFTLAMVEAVCADEGRTVGALDLLAGLADKSWVVLLPRDSEREAHYRLLEVLRQYARELLEESGEAARIRDRYLTWCLDWAEPAAEHLIGPERAGWLGQFEVRQEHIRASLRWACSHGRSEAGLRLAGALGRYWLTTSLSEGRTWLDELLALVDGQAAEAPAVPDLVRAWAQFYSGRLAVRQGDPAHGLRRGEQSLALFRAAADRRGSLAALNLLALAAQDSLDFGRAHACYAEGLALSRQRPDERMTAVLLVNQGLMYYERQDFRRAAPIWDEAYALIERLHDDSIASRDNLGCLAMMQGRLGQAYELLERELHRQAGNASGLGILAMDLGEVARRQGDLDRASVWLHQALERLQPVGDQARIGETLANLGNLSRHRGDLHSAKSYYEQSLVCLEYAGYTRLISQVKTGLGLLAAAQGGAEEALAYFRAGLQTALAGQHQLSRVEALEGILDLLARRGESERAARWLAATGAARDSIGAPLPPVERGRLDELGQALRQTLGPARYAALADEAAALNLEEMTAEALAAPHRPAPFTATAPAPDEDGLRVLALGDARVLVGRRALGSSDWTYAKSKELFFYLLSRGPASKAQIGLDLWPDASPGQLRTTFHSVLHHLRRALGRPEWIVHIGGEYSINGHLSFDYDVQSFEELVRSAQQELRAAAQPAGRARSIAHLEAAVALWRGDFLADSQYGDWAVFQREALRQTFLEAVLKLADLRFAEANYPAAAAAYRRALDLDSYLELAHRGLMRCCTRQGEAAQALRHYQDLRQLLRKELSATPSSETTLLYDRIRRGDDI